ncbi:MAG: response regulator [Bryobacteraceae bacterium]|nr:response regulator [Bryobacteraceae bacterium]
MQKNNRKKIVVAVTDLMFTVKINDAAKKVGLHADFVKSEQDVMDKAAERPTAIIIDLNCRDINPLKLIPKLKGKPDFKGISLIGYLSHVQGDLKKQAHDAGCDIVMTRSAFSQNLQQILKRHADAK